MALAAAVGAMALPGMTISSASAAGAHSHNVISKVEQKSLTIAGLTSSGELTVGCPTNYYAIDGGFVLDSVDTGGEVSDVNVRLSAPTTGFSGWRVDVVNDNPVPAQGKVQVTCVSKTTAKAGPDGHVHTMSIPVQQTSTFSSASVWGHSDPEGTFTTNCPANTIATGPVFEFHQGSATLNRLSLDGAKLTMSMLANEASKTFTGAVCVDPALAPDQYLVFENLVVQDTLTVPENRFADMTLTCPDGGTAASIEFSTEPGVLYVGNDHRINARAPRYYNDTDDTDVVKDFGVLCIGARTGTSPTPLTFAVSPTVTKASSGKYIIASVECSSGCKIKARLKGNQTVGNAGPGRFYKGTTIAYGKGKTTAGGTATVRLVVKSRFRDTVKNNAFSAVLHVTVAGETITQTVNVP
ncbi:hypothetical protein [Nocardioides ferulae]|uniref:hypothetical protein n=1 Tax=Nocardioides ferulae TaxID=2340821 RepID=UPI000EB36F89|nr:hypothetical protein [Nocardioides ferulae]